MRYVLLGAYALSLSSCILPPGALEQTATLRVMTYNIQAGGGNLGDIAEVIRVSGADIVALQEVDVRWHSRSGFADQAAELAERLGMQVRFAPIYHLPGADAVSPPREYGVALLSRFPVVASTNHAITRLSTQEGRSSPSAMPGFLEAAVDVLGVRVRVFSTHLDYRGDPAVRRQQVSESLAIIGAPTTPVLLLGDLNASPAAPELQPLFARLRDSWPDSAGPGFTYPAQMPVRRIDYVLTSDHFRAVSARVIETRASDHRPVVVDLMLR